MKMGIEYAEDGLQLLAHNGSAFDTYVVLNSLSNWHKKVSRVKCGKDIVSSTKYLLEL